VDGIEHGIEMSEAEAQLLVKSGTWLGLTLNSFLNPRRLNNRYGGRVPERIITRQERVRTNLTRAMQMGVRWTLGTDAQHGEMAFELEAAVSLGATQLDAIAGATSRAAESCGIAHQTGTLEPGKLADIIAVRGNPAADITCLWHVDAVIKGGQRWDHVSVV
jgi:imidazolonepropionase-like amidohydrolase